VNQRIADVLVVGGGPAGSALSLRLARAGCSVILLERTAYAEFRVGESLPPSAVPILTRLGIWESFLRTQPAPVYGVQSAWGAEELESSSFLANPFMHGWHLDRGRFDAMLSSAAKESGAQVFRQTSVRTIERLPQGLWLITATSPQGERSYLARFLVDATGRSAHLSTQIGVGRRRVDRLVGVSKFFDEKPCGDPRPSLIEAHPLGWWYSARLPGGAIIAIFFTDSDLCARYHLTQTDFWSRILQESRYTRDRLSECVSPNSMKTFPAASHCLHQAAGDSWVAIGDAVIGRDPLSSSGIEFALASAERAFSALSGMAKGDGESADAYNAEVRADFSAYIDHYQAYYVMERRWPNSSFWRRRHLALTAGDQTLVAGCGSPKFKMAVRSTLPKV
jgi:flavin-dependent dehydrogenase